MNQANKWKKTLDYFINKCFRKIRIKKRKTKLTEISDLMQKRKEAMIAEDNDVQENIEEIIKSKESNQKVLKISIVHKWRKNNEILISIMGVSQQTD